MLRRQNDRERNRERERRARGSRKYGQAKLKHAKRGVISCVLAGVVFFILTAMITASYKSGGHVGRYAGGLGLITMLLSGLGLYAAFRGFKEREKDYLTCKIGAGCHIFFLLGFTAIFLRGLF